MESMNMTCDLTDREWFNPLPANPALKPISHSVFLTRKSRDRRLAIQLAFRPPRPPLSQLLAICHAIFASETCCK